MAWRVRPSVGGRWVPQHAWVWACALPSTSSPPRCWAGRPPCARVGVRRATPCGSGGAGPALTPRGSPRRDARWPCPWRARAERVARPESGRGDGARRPTEAGAAHGTGARAPRHRPPTLRHAGLAPARGGPATVRTGLAHLSTLLPSPRRALPAGPCGVAVAGGRVPTSAWMLNLPILTSGGSQGAPAPPHHEIRGNVCLRFSRTSLFRWAFPRRDTWR